MPIYEYQCQACGHEIEVIQKMSDAPLTDCPECKQPKLKKLISASAFRLKGGGWYETDFKSGKKKNLAKGESGDKPKGDANKNKVSKTGGKASSSGGTT
jgi:putative FmdB family regulatory protein